MIVTTILKIWDKVVRLFKFPKNPNWLINKLPDICPTKTNMVVNPEPIIGIKKVLPQTYIDPNTSTKPYP